MLEIVMTGLAALFLLALLIPGRGKQQRDREGVAWARHVREIGERED